MKKTFSFIIFVILIVCIFVLSKVPAGYKQEIERRDTIYRGRLDSIKGVITGLEKGGEILRIKVDSLSHVTEIALNKATQWKQRYDQAKKAPVRHLPDSVLASRLAAYR